MAYGENTIQKPTFLANTITTGTHVISATEESGLVIDFPTEKNQNTSDNANFGDLVLYNKADLQLTASAYSYDVLLTESGDIGESGYVWKANSDATTEYNGTFDDYVIMPMNKFLNDNATAQNTTINFSSITANYVRIISALEIKNSGNINPGLLVIFVADESTDDKKVYSVYYAGAVASNWTTPVQIGTINTTGRYSGALYKLTDGTVLFTMITAAARTLTTYKWTVSSNTWATYGSTKDLSQFTQVAIGGVAVDDYNTVVLGVCDPSIEYPYPCVLVSYGGTGDWTDPIVLFDYGGPPSLVYKKDGKFLAIWEDFTNRTTALKSNDILAKESIDGKTWTLLDTEDLTGTVLSDYITPNTNISGSRYFQLHLPKIAVLSDGRLAVIAFYAQNDLYVDRVAIGSDDFGLVLVISDDSVGESWKYYTKLTHQGIVSTLAYPILHTLTGKSAAELTITYGRNNVDHYGNYLVVYNNELLYIHSPKPTTNTKSILFSRILPNQKTIFLKTPNAVLYHTACLAIPDTATSFWEQEGAGTTTFAYSNEFVNVPAGVTYHAETALGLNTIEFNSNGIYGFTSWSCQKFATNDTAKIKFDFIKENDPSANYWLGRATEVTMTEAAGTVTIKADSNTIGTISSVNDTKEYEFVFVCGQQESDLDSTALLLKGFYKQNTSDKWTSLTGYTNALITNSGITVCDVHWGSQAGDNSHWRWFYLYTGCPQNTWESIQQAGYYPGESQTTGVYSSATRVYRVLIKKGSIKKSGKKLRIYLNNTSASAVTYSSIIIAEKETGAFVDNLVDYTEKDITFYGSLNITINSTTAKWSDWIDFDFDENKDYFIQLSNSAAEAMPYVQTKSAITEDFTFYKDDINKQTTSDWDDPPEETVSGGGSNSRIAGIVEEIQVLEDVGNNRDLLNETNLNYKKLIGRKTSVYPQTIQNGIDIYFGGNKGSNEDQWLVQTKWLYAKENIIIGSPSKEWRSRQDDTAVNIVISKGAMEYENGSIALINTNFINCNLRRVSDNGLIATLDSTISSLGASLFSQNGKIVHITYTGTDDKRYIGKYIKFQNGSGNTEVRKVVSSFKFNATTLAMEIDTTPSIASINSMVLYTDRMYSIGTVDATYLETQLKIEITSQPAYGGYYKIGKCIFGQHLILNEYRSEGSVHTLTGQVAITKTRAGVMFAGKKGEAYRTITLNFEYADVKTQMEVDNFIKYIDFGKYPFVYWDEQSIPDDALLMRMTDQSIPRKHIARGDLFTIEQFTLTEEL